MESLRCSSGRAGVVLGLILACAPGISQGQTEVEKGSPTSGAGLWTVVPGSGYTGAPAEDEGADLPSTGPGEAGGEWAPSEDLPGLDPALWADVKSAFGDLLISPSREDTATAILRNGRVLFERAEGMWARVNPPSGAGSATRDSTFIMDYLRGVEALEAAQVEATGGANPRRMIAAYEEARAAFLAVLEQDPGNEAARSYLVLCLERLAESFESASLYRKAEGLYRSLIDHKDRSSWYYHYRLMLVLDRLRRSYDALEIGWVAEDLLLQEVHGLLPRPGGTELSRDEARTVRRIILERRRALERDLGLFDAMVVTTNRLQATLTRSERSAGAGIDDEFVRARAWDPMGAGQAGFYRHLELVKTYNDHRFQEAYAGWKRLLESTEREEAQLVVDYYLALIERSYLNLPDLSLRRAHAWWDRYRGRQEVLAVMGARYLSTSDQPDGAYLLEDFGASCDRRGKEMLGHDRVRALAYFKQSSEVLWSQRAAAAYNAAALVPRDLAERFLLEARAHLLMDLNPIHPAAAAPLARNHGEALAQVAPRIYEDLMLFARRTGRLSWLVPLRDELEQIRTQGWATPSFSPGGGRDAS